MMLEKLYEDNKYRIYLWKNWVLSGRPLQIYFCKSNDGAAPQDDSFYVGKDKTLQACQGLRPLPYEDYMAVLSIIHNNDLINKAIDISTSTYGRCIFKE